jgi:outer membrane protein
LKELTKMALQYNLDIAIQDTNQELQQQNLKQQIGSVYDPTLTGSIGRTSSRSPNTNPFDLGPGEFITSDNLSTQAAFSQTVKTGGKIDVQWQSYRRGSNSNSALSPVIFNSTATVTFTQPLRRNLRIDSQRNQIKVINLDIRTTEVAFKQKVSDTISTIQASYWDLVSAVRNYEIRRNSVKLAQINLRDNRKKVEVGTLAPIEVTDAEANVASREVDLISAEETILRAENSLRSLISNDRASEIWKKVIVPIDLPDFKEYKVDATTAIETALAKRPELETAKLNLQKQDLNTALLKNNRKWGLDLRSNFGTTGNVNRPDNMLDAYSALFTDRLTNWGLTLNMTVPLRNRSLNAQIAKQGIQKRQDLMSIRKTEQSIQVEIGNAIQTLETNRKQVETAGVARRLSKERLDGEEKRFQAGLSQNYLVLDRQNQLASAEYAELQALIRYKQAITTLQKAMYTLLESNDIEISRGSATKVPDLK